MVKQIIICIGDSITWGTGESPTKGWVGRLKDTFEQITSDHKVYNLGIGGQTTQEIWERFDVEINARLRYTFKTEKFFLIVSGGTNDAKSDFKTKLPRTTEEEFRKRVHILLTKAKKAKIEKCFVVGLPPVDEKYTMPMNGNLYYIENKRIMLFNQILKEAAQKANLEFIEINSLFTKDKFNSHLADGVHPNKEGYNLMFSEIRKHLKKNKVF